MSGNSGQRNYMPLGGMSKVSLGSFGNRGANQANQAAAGAGGNKMYQRGGYGGGYGGYSGYGGYGNRYALKQPQRPSVPITTVGLPFTSMEKIEKSANNQRKAYQVFHINMVAMFSQFTTEELRIYDYISTDQIQPIQSNQQTPNQNYSLGGYHTSGLTNNPNQPKVFQKTVNWYTVPYEKWEKIKEPEEFCKGKSDSDTFYKKPYSNLDPPNPILTNVSKNKEEAEIAPNNRIKLKGFKTSSVTFSSLLESKNSDQSAISNDTSFKLEDFKIRLQFSVTPTSRQTTNHSQAYSERLSTNIRSSNKLSQNQSSEKNVSPSGKGLKQNELMFIPDLYNLREDVNIISNLSITKNMGEINPIKVKLVFPLPLDLKKIDPKNNVKIESLSNTDKQLLISSKKYDFKNGLKITIEIPNNNNDNANNDNANNDNDNNNNNDNDSDSDNNNNNSEPGEIDDSEPCSDNTHKELNGKENKDDICKTQTIIFINDPNVQSFYIKKNQEGDFSERKEQIVNEFIPDLNCYPIIILFKMK